MTFRSRVFATALLATAVTLSVAVGLLSYNVRSAVNQRIEQSLVAQARLAAETLSHRRPATPEELDAEADDLGRLVSARVTFIAPDGTVIGDSELSATALRAAENHAGRPEVVQAARDGFGVARRHSTTIGTDMLYVAVPVKNAAVPELAQVRLALPLTDVSDQLQAVRQAAIAAAFVGLLPRCCSPGRRPDFSPSASALSRMWPSVTRRETSRGRRATTARTRSEWWPARWTTPCARSAGARPL